jgi:hypothetical protein
MKSARLYLIYFQSSAARPQAGDRILCSPAKPFRAEGRRDAGFRHSQSGQNRRPQIEPLSAAVKISRKPHPASDLDHAPAFSGSQRTFSILSLLTNSSIANLSR